MKIVPQLGCVSQDSDALVSQEKNVQETRCKKSWNQFRGYGSLSLRYVKRVFGKRKYHRLEKYMSPCCPFSDRNCRGQHGEADPPSSPVSGGARSESREEADRERARAPDPPGNRDTMHIRRREHVQKSTEEQIVDVPVLQFDGKLWRWAGSSRRSAQLNRPSVPQILHKELFRSSEVSFNMFLGVCEQILDMHFPQVVAQLTDVTKNWNNHTEHCSAPSSHTFDVFVPRIVEECVGLATLAPQERVATRICEQIGMLFVVPQISNVSVLLHHRDAGRAGICWTDLRWLDGSAGQSFCPNSFKYFFWLRPCFSVEPQLFTTKKDSPARERTRGESSTIQKLVVLSAVERSGEGGLRTIVMNYEFPLTPESVGDHTAGNREDQDPGNQHVESQWSSSVKIFPGFSTLGILE